MKKCDRLMEIPIEIVGTRQRRFLRLKDVQAELGCSKGHAANLIRRGRIECYRLDGLLLIDAASFDAYLDGAVPAPQKQPARPS